MVDVLQALKKNPFVLAPMAGITDFPFRSFMREMGCSVVITELVSANGLKFNSEKTRKLMEFEEIQRPIGIQLFGETPEVIAEGAKYAQEMGADFVDLNFGCPVKKVVTKGAGSAVLKDLGRLTEIVRTVKKAIAIPLTIKIRTGWDENTRNAHEVVKIAHNEGVTWVAIHGRTRSAGYSGKADWNYIGEVKAKSPLPVLGNGDLVTPEDAVEKLRQTGCDGVMIGRGCLKNPYIFQQAQALWSAGPSGAAQIQSPEFTELIRRLLTYLGRTYDERITKIQLRKFAGWYSAGYPNSSEFRKNLYACEDLERLSSITLDYFGEVRKFAQKDTSQEAFLMGGHG